ncbi:hypothetical protein FQR65_LT07118 [Abscondita terminalis]|nr:hypothetical protein FQR65_LT07118 [Abscondita terminalis]
MCQRFSVLVFIVLVVLAKISESEVTFINSSRSLSRKKRFLIFPEGSSLQLVFCFTIPSVGMGRIFTIGWTAALAWELPHEPIHPLKKKTEAMKRVDKPGTLSSGGWVVEKGSSSTSDKYKNIYKDSISKYATIKDYLTNPGYTKIRYNGNPDTSYREYLKGKYVDYRPIYDAFAIRPSFKSNNVMKEAPSFYEHPVYREVHRRTRRDLFGKIEKFLDAQRQDGKACLLKAICEVSQRSSNHVGTFMEEIIKAIFKVKPHKKTDYEDEYDLAADESHNCNERYSRCASSIWNFL